MKRQISVLIAILAVTSVALAHGNEQHVMGTVTEVTESSITVETKDHKQIKVSVIAETKFMEGTSSATLKDLKVGDRVVIHAAKAQDGLQAHTVRIGAAQAAEPMSHRHHKAQYRRVITPAE